MWEAPILEKESLSWATPQAFDMNDCQRSAEALARAKTKGGCKNLREEVSSWPTPRKVDTEDGNENNVEYSNGHFSEIRKSTQVRYGAKLCNAAASWPTPRNQDSYERSNWKTIVDANTGGKTQMTLTRKVKYEANQNNAWPTPNASRSGAMKGDNPRGKHAGNPLKTASESWPTPRMNDFKGHCTDATTRKDGKCRNDQLVNAAIHTGPSAPVKKNNGSDSSKSAQTSPQPLKKRLNPKFVEHLMGMPLGWSLPIPIDQNDYKRWETESCHLLRLLHSASYGNE
jgi:hypothetical protein